MQAKNNIKICSKCKNPKSILEFCNNKCNIDGLECWCRECHKEKIRIKNQIRQRKYKETRKRYNDTHKEQMSKQKAEKRLSTRYGITIEDYRVMQENQNGKCSICNKEQTRLNRNNKPIRLAVDHDHKTGRIRGLLCYKCNSGIGYFNDNIELLSKPINYLTKE